MGLYGRLYLAGFELGELKRHMNRWSPLEIDAGSCYTWQIGPLDLWIKRTKNEWHIARSQEPGSEERLSVEKVAEPRQELTWRRWAAHRDDHAVVLEPIMPDRPVVVRPESPILLPAGYQATFFVGIPIWIRVKTGPEQKTLLSEEPTVNLSNSWFGAPTEGDLCYALRTRAKRQIDELSRRPYRAVCALQIRNASESVLDFQRLCLRVQHLSVYEGKGHLWTNEGSVTHRGEDQWSRVVYGNLAPEFDREAMLVGKAREVASEGFLSKTFDNLKSFANL